jgi:hypothetical protein
VEDRVGPLPTSRAFPRWYAERRLKITVARTARISSTIRMLGEVQARSCTDNSVTPKTARKIPAMDAAKRFIMPDTVPCKVRVVWILRSRTSRRVEG